MSTCLILVKPWEIVRIRLSKVLRPFHHKVDEVSAASKAACDQNVCQNSEEPSEMYVLIFLVLLFIHNGFLPKSNLSQFNGANLEKTF